RGRVRLRRLVRQRDLRSDHQGGDEGDDPSPARRRIPFCRNAQDMPEMRRRRHHRGTVGKGILGERSISDRGSMADERGDTPNATRRTGEGQRMENVPLQIIAREVGTPTYVYSSG